MDIPEALTAPDPLADVAASVVQGRTRITVLTDRLLRIEHAADGEFEDRASLAIANRRFAPVEFRADSEGSRLTVTTADVELSIADTDKAFTRSNVTARIGRGRGAVQWHYGAKDHKNLGGTRRTLDGWRGSRSQDFLDIDEMGMIVFDDWKDEHLDPGLLSRNGWSVFDDTGSPVLDPGSTGRTRPRPRPWPTTRPDGRRNDLYLFAYGDDHRSALRDAAQLFGPQPLPPRFAFGYWYSRYHAYTDRELLEIVDQFDRFAVPIDVVVVDMDWHKAGWTGYSWDRRYFPDPDDTLARLHDKGLHVALNVHPSDGVARHEDAFAAMCADLGLDESNTGSIPFDVSDRDFMAAYFKHLHHPEEDRGVDFWWMDWQQGEHSAIPGLDPLPWLNQLHWEDQAVRHRNRRPLVFSRWGGLGGGRYPIGFSGDTWSVWESLAFQPEFTSTAANVLYGYWSHDIGGHYGPITTPELYTRWLQFGTYSPILRTHATKHPDQERRFWEFGDPYRSAVTQTVRRRYELVPYIYTECRRGVSSGLSLVRPMYHEHPGVDPAYGATDQYYFGGDFIVAPVLAPVEDDTMAPVRVWLPKGRYYDTAHGTLVNVRPSAGEWTERRYLLEEVPAFVVAGAVIPGLKDADRLGGPSYENLVVSAYPGGDGDYDLYEDDGTSQGYMKGDSVTIPLCQRVTHEARTVSIGPAEGRYRGWISKKPVEVRIVHELPPAEVQVNGAALAMASSSDGRGLGSGHGHSETGDYWYYDTASASVVVRLGQVNLRKPTTVGVHRDSTLPKNAARLLDGFPGLARRLDAMAGRAGQASASHELHPDERLAVDLAQAANRVTRDPSTFVAELCRVRKELPRLDAIFKDWGIAWHSALRFPFSNQEEVSVAMLQEARRILTTTTEQFG
ncbi:MAG: TIM-barrel domain-containing protein [Microthrixaceae bacterium]